MGIKYASVKLSSLSDNFNLRLCYSGERPQTVHPLVKFLGNIEFYESGSRPKGGIVHFEGDDFAISLGGEQIGKDGSIDLSNMPIVPLEYYESCDKGKVNKYDILVCKDGALTGKSCFVADEFPIKEVMINEHIYIFRSNDKILQRFLFYLISSHFVQFQIKDLAYRKKGQPGLNSEHLSLIKIPFFEIDQQKEICSRLAPIEKKVDKLKKGKRSISKIINDVIGSELDFDWGKFESLKKEKLFYSSITDFAGNIDCRMGCRFHNKAGKYLYDFICSKTDKRIKDLIAEPIVLGKSVSPKDYDDDGEYYYIAMSNIKTWAFEPEDCKKVCEDYSLANQNKTVQKNDILLARSGEGTIGKVALIEDDEIQAIFADFTQRIRLENYDFKLAYYFFRSEFFQYLVYTHKKGLGNNTNIFPRQIQEFPIPDWSAEKQKEIVAKIQKLIEEQNEIDKQIELKQKEIQMTIEDFIRKEDI